MANRIEYVPTPDRQRITWPNGARIAFYVGFNIEYFDMERPYPQQPNVPCRTC